MMNLAEKRIELENLSRQIEAMQLYKDALAEYVKVSENGFDLLPVEVREIKKRRSFKRSKDRAVAKPIKQRRISASSSQKFRDEIVGIANDVKTQADGNFRVRDVVDLAIQRGFLRGGKKRDRELQRVAASMTVAAKEKRLNKIDNGKYTKNA